MAVSVRSAFKKTIKNVVLAAAVALMTIGSSGLAIADGDAVAGKKIFKKCSVCHKIGEGAKNAVGPVLTGVVGRTAGTFADYKYGKSTKAAGEAGLVWDEEKIFDYLQDPKKFLRALLDDKKAKSKMTFKLKKEEDRLNVIAYLKTFSPEE